MKNILSTYASDAGADNKSRVSGARLWYTAWRSIQNSCHWHLCVIVTPSCTVLVQLLLEWWTLGVLDMDVGHFSSQKLQHKYWYWRSATAGSTWLRVVGHLLCLCQCMLNHIQLGSTKKTRHRRSRRRNWVEVDDVRLQQTSKLMTDRDETCLCCEPATQESESSLPIWSTHSLEELCPGLGYVHFFHSAWNFRSRFYSVHL